jgi:hypothetical protein
MFYSLKTEFPLNTNTNSVRTSQETCYAFATETNGFKETSPVSFQNHMEHTNMFCGYIARIECVEGGGIYYNHWVKWLILSVFPPRSGKVYPVTGLRNFI